VKTRKKEKLPYCTSSKNSLYIVVRTDRDDKFSSRILENAGRTRWGKVMTLNPTSAYSGRSALAERKGKSRYPYCKSNQDNEMSYDYPFYAVTRQGGGSSRFDNPIRRSERHRSC